MKRSRFTEEQIISTLKQAEAGAKVQDVIWKLGVTEQALYRWKAKFGGMEASDARSNLTCDPGGSACHPCYRLRMSQAVTSDVALETVARLARAAVALYVHERRSSELGRIPMNLPEAWLARETSVLSRVIDVVRGPDHETQNLDGSLEGDLPNALIAVILNDVLEKRFPPTEWQRRAIEVLRQEERDRRTREDDVKRAFGWSDVFAAWTNVTADLKVTTNPPTFVSLRLPLSGFEVEPIFEWWPRQDLDHILPLAEADRRRSWQERMPGYQATARSLARAQSDSEETAAVLLAAALEDPSIRSERSEIDWVAFQRAREVVDDFLRSRDRWPWYGNIRHVLPGQLYVTAQELAEVRNQRGLSDDRPFIDVILLAALHVEKALETWALVKLSSPEREAG